MPIPSPITVALAALACALWIYALGIAYDAVSAPPPRYCTDGVCVIGWKMPPYTVTTTTPNPR